MELSASSWESEPIAARRRAAEPGPCPGPPCESGAAPARPCCIRRWRASWTSAAVPAVRPAAGNRCPRCLWRARGLVRENARRRWRPRFGVGVNRRCPAELGRDQLGDERDPGRAPDQQDRIKLRAVDGCRLQRPVQRLDGPVQVWPDHFLELGPGQPDPLPHAAERHRDGGVGVHRQGFLRLGALAAQPGDLGNDVRIVRVDPGQWHPGGGAYVLEQHLVKGDPAKPVDPFGPAKDRERGRRVLTDHSGVEGPPAQVVYGQMGADLDPLRLA